MSPLKPVTVKTRRGFLVVVLALACLSLPMSAYFIGWKLTQTSDRADDNCARIHAIVKVGGEIIEGGKASLAKYLADGTITRAQYERGLKDTDKQLARWRTADCP